MVSRKICKYLSSIYFRKTNHLDFLRQFYLNKSLRESRFDPRGTITDKRQISTRSAKNNEAKRLVDDIDDILVCNNLTCLIFV